MKLSDNWFTALSEDNQGKLVTIHGRDDITAFVESGKFKERVEITWKYEPDDKGFPVEEVAVQMDNAEQALKKIMEKDKLAILTGIYTGDGEKMWVFYTRTSRVFGERLNEALLPMELLPITLYVETDPQWDEYRDMLEMKAWRVD